MARRQRVMMEAPIARQICRTNAKNQMHPTTDCTQSASRPSPRIAPHQQGISGSMIYGSVLRFLTRHTPAAPKLSTHAANTAPNREQQGREQAEEQVGPAEPQPRQHGRTARRAARQRLKLRGKLLRRPQLRGDLFLRIPVCQLEREVLSRILPSHRRHPPHFSCAAHVRGAS